MRTHYPKKHRVGRDADDEKGEDDRDYCAYVVLPLGIGENDTHDDKVEADAKYVEHCSANVVRNESTSKCSDAGIVHTDGSFERAKGCKANADVVGPLCETDRQKRRREDVAHDVFHSSGVSQISRRCETKDERSNHAADHEHAEDHSVRNAAIPVRGQGGRPYEDEEKERTLEARLHDREQKDSDVGAQQMYRLYEAVEESAP